MSRIPPKQQGLNPYYLHSCKKCYEGFKKVVYEEDQKDPIFEVTWGGDKDGQVKTVYD